VDEIKLINGVKCVVARTSSRIRLAKPSTRTTGTPRRRTEHLVLREETAELRRLPGDDPQLLEVVTIGRSFKWGRERDKGGIIFLASPKVGDTYLEEFSLGNAEDVTEILSTTYAYGAGGDLDQMVPAALAQIMCAAGDCVVTKNYSLLEPGDFARKYYAKGIGVFLEVESMGEVVQLVECNFDPQRCTGLPQP
jgi:hypothetical protein